MLFQSGRAIRSTYSSALARSICNQNGKETNLMVFEPQVAKMSIVVFHAVAQILQTWLVFVHLVASNEPFVELNDLSESEVLTGRSIESPCRLNQLLHLSATAQSCVRSRAPSKSHSQAPER